MEFAGKMLNDGIEKVHQKFELSILPIYRANSHGQPEQEGSCLLAAVNGEKYLIAAAHIVDVALEYSLFLGCNPLFPINTTFLEPSLKITGEM